MPYYLAEGIKDFKTKRTIDKPFSRLSEPLTSHVSDEISSIVSCYKNEYECTLNKITKCDKN